MYELRVVRERRPGYGRCRRMRTSQDLYQAFRGYFAALDREHFLAVLLDTKNAILGFNVVSVGTLNGSLVHPREVHVPVLLYVPQAHLRCSTPGAAVELLSGARCVVLFGIARQPSGEIPGW